MSRKTNRDHAKRQQRPTIEDEAIAGQLEDLLINAIASQRKYCRQLGLQDRILTLLKVSQQALSKKISDFSG